MAQLKRLFLYHRLGQDQHIENFNGAQPTRRHRDSRWSAAVAVTFLLVTLLPSTISHATTQPPYTWALTSSMTLARAGHTATLLPNGKVLVAGGGTASAELYDPSTGAWAPTGSMSVARTNHTATLLPDGTVLVAGGCCTPDGHGRISAEIYNPTTGLWHPSGRMTVGRQGHTATLLPDGKVLVTGGGCLTVCDSGSFLENLRSAELYDPATRTWTVTSSMAFEREFHTATLLQNGQVLVTGGFASCDDDSCIDNASAELYNPSTATWTTTGAMHISREQHTATLLPDGRVLVAGGLHEIPVGGGTASKDLASAEVYDPTTGAWSMVAAMASTRVGHTAVLLHDGQVLVSGGGTDSSEVYQPQRGIWVSTGPMTTSRTHATATVLSNGTVLVAGGRNQGVDLASAEVFSSGPGPLAYLTPTNLDFPSQFVGSSNSLTITVLNAGSAAMVVSSVTATGTNKADFIPTSTCAAPLPAGKSCTVAVQFMPSNTGLRSAAIEVADNAPLSPQEVDVSGYGAGPHTWSPTGALNVGRILHMSVLLQDGRVLVAGGQPPNDPLTFLSSAELYDPDNSVWALTGSMHTPRDLATLTLLPNGDILVAGGDSTTYIPQASAELYHLSTGTWTTTGSMHNARYAHTATLLPTGKVLVAGGAGTTAELYDPATGTWALTGSMTAAHSYATATLLPTGKVLVAGGDATGKAAELYDPATGSWTATGSLHVGHVRHTATLLSNGEVLVVGGYPSCCNNPSASAELYNPGTGIWTLTGSLHTARAEQTATLLHNGTVLIAGGVTCSSSCAASTSAEIYDPNTGTWTPTGALTIARSEHTATLLRNGEVLAAGGDTKTGTAVDLYTP